MLNMALGSAAAAEKYLSARATPSPEFCMPASMPMVRDSFSLNYPHNDTKNGRLLLWGFCR